MSTQIFNLPEQVRFIIDRLAKRGYRADVVGGPVRDMLLGKVPYDYDITTSARPEEIKSVFSDFRTVDTGIKHGTVTLVIDKVGYEITTYRIDGEYLDSRHPRSVSFTKELSEDLARRDFTMNAIAYSNSHGITDLYGGREDIENRAIRAVGDPDLRFTEDALRILRGIRFSSCLDFDVEEKTESAIRRNAHLLTRVSVERVYTEWFKLLSGSARYSVISNFADVISVFLPEIADNGNGNAKIILPDGESRDNASPLSLMLSLFYLNAGERYAAAYKSAMTRLHTDSFTRDIGTLALTVVGNGDTATAVGIGKLMMDLGREAVGLAIDTEILLGIRSSSSRQILDMLIEKRAPYRTSDLDINGNDLIDLGYEGAKIGKVMRMLLTEVIEQKIENSRKILIKRAEELFGLIY